ncbi:hypothetical protein SK128_017357 [Halocaridina rubra]|uniref:Uncharacterized protein n=1 Tax=Halocaridina rubra TaxID=373956 RepID=A0AAN8WPX7_HALRR
MDVVWSDMRVYGVTEEDAGDRVTYWLRRPLPGEAEIIDDHNSNLFNTIMATVLALG